MKVRRVGPGGYGNTSWHGACQADTNPTSFGSLYAPSLHLQPDTTANGVLGVHSAIAANVITQPSTFILPASAQRDAKTAWHVLEWDMWNLGTYDDDTAGRVLPLNGGDVLDDNKMWQWANSTTGTSQQDGGAGRRIGSISFHLCFNPDNSDEKFEIEWIQVDDGTAWPRGSFALPGGMTTNTTTGISSSGAGTGGLGGYNKIRVVDSADQSTQTMGNFAVSAEPTVTLESEVEYNFPVIYVNSNKRVKTDSIVDRVFDANGAIFRVSGTANNREWVTTEIVDSEKFLRTVNTIAGTVTGDAQPSEESARYIGASITANGHFSGPVLLETDENDNLYVGYIYEHDDAGSPTYPGLVDKSDPKPLMLFRLTPLDNVQSTIATTADPHNLYADGTGPAAEPMGRSNTYVAEQILWGNVGGTDGIGTMTGGNDYSLSHGNSSERELAGTSMIVDFSTDGFGSLYTVGGASQNIIKILPAANGAYGNGVTQFVSPLGGQLSGRKVIEVANTSTLDSNNQVLADESAGKSWTPIQIIPGPKDSLFVACDTAYDELRGGTDGADGIFKYSKSVYCYHIVVTQNVATGSYATKNVYPVFSNTASQHLVVGSGTRHANLAGLQESCAGMVLDNNDPPNLYYMTSNNMYIITPKGRSYEEGNATIEKVFPERYFEDTLGWSEDKMGMLGWASSIEQSTANGVWQENYQHIQVDARNRIYFGGRSNLYCYSRGTNTQFSNSIMYNVSNTEFSTLTVVANTDMYTANISWNMGLAGLTDVSIDNFVLGERGVNHAAGASNSHSEGVYFVMHGYDGANGDIDAPRALCVVYPNANGSFVSDEGGQLALTLMSQDPAANTQFAVEGTGGQNKYRGMGPSLIAMRPEKTK